MGAKLHVRGSVARDVGEKLARCGIPVAAFAEWKSEVEFELSEDPKSKLTYVARDGTYEYSWPMEYADRRFETLWGLAWEGDFHLVDFGLIDLTPKLARDKKPDG